MVWKRFEPVVRWYQVPYNEITVRDMFIERQLVAYSGAGFDQARAEAAFETAQAFLGTAEDYLTEVGFL
jgi:hypothetical protein